MHYQEILNQIFEEIKPIIGSGQVANYIPALKNIDPNKFGMSIDTVDGGHFEIGDCHELFSIQSISKVFTLTMAMSLCDTSLWTRVGREPSGSKFNSLVPLEYEQGIPRNPFINAGAHVITDIINSKVENPKEKILDFIRKLSENNTINFDLEVTKSERETGHRNLAMAYFMKSFGNIYNDVIDTLDIYFHQCAIAMSCCDLSKAFL